MSAMTDDHNGNSAADLFCWWRSLPLNHRPNFCEGDGVKEESLADPWGLSTFGAIAEDGMGVGDKPSPLIPRASSTPSRFQPDVGASYFGDASGDFGASVPAGWMQPKVEIETRALKQCWDDSGVSLQAPSGMCVQVLGVCIPGVFCPVPAARACDGLFGRAVF